jgi:hypothetical protein
LGVDSGLGLPEPSDEDAREVGWTNFLRGIEHLSDDLQKMVIEEAIDHRKHLQRMESREMRLAEQGQVMAFASSIFFGIVALWTTLAGHSEVGVVVASTTIAALAAAFIVGRRYSGAAKPDRA